MNWPWKRKTVVLGSELAAARQSEEARIASGMIGDSPLPPERYDYEGGDYDLVAISPIKLDLDIRDLTKEFTSWSLDRRNEVMQIIPSDDLYMLIHFVKRASVLALNRDTLEWCRAGLVALSLIDETRVDWRDMKLSAGLLEHTLLSVPEVDRQMEDLVNVSKPIAAFISQLSKVSHLREWGYSEFQRGDAVGLIETGSSPYNPTLDLTGIALLISEQLSKGRYITHVEIATNPPEIWFDRKRHNDVRKKLDDCLAAATIHGTLRKKYGDDLNQMFVAWIVEMPSADDCEHLVEAVGAGTPLVDRYAVGVSEGKLFAILVAGSAQHGVEAIESPSSLRELAGQITLVLTKTVT